jgi:hypothetical protein
MTGIQAKPPLQAAIAPQDASINSCRSDQYEQNCEYEICNVDRSISARPPGFRTRSPSYATSWSRVARASEPLSGAAASAMWRQPPFDPRGVLVLYEVDEHGDERCHHRSSYCPHPRLPVSNQDPTSECVGFPRDDRTPYRATPPVFRRIPGENLYRERGLSPPPFHPPVRGARSLGRRGPIRA